jgi:hypothetical protein
MLREKPEIAGSVPSDTARSRLDSLLAGDRLGRRSDPRRSRAEWATGPLPSPTTPGQLAEKEPQHSRRGRCEDRIRGTKDTGLPILPPKGSAQNQIRREIPVGPRNS